MRICLYTDTALPKMGGQEMVVDVLAREFQQLGHDVLVLAPHPRLPLIAQDKQLPYPVVRHPRFYSTRFFVNWYRHFLLKLFRRFPFQVLHCHGVYPPGYLAAETRNRIGVPVVITSHGGDVRDGNIRLSKPIVRIRQTKALQTADRLVAISKFTEKGYLRLGADPTRLVTIPNGVNLEPFAQSIERPSDLSSGVQPDEYVLFLGRMKRRKGVDLLLKAMKGVPATNNVQLVLAGIGDDLEEFRQLASELELLERVEFVGAAFGETKIWLLKNALCTILPTRLADAFPLVVLESYAAGTPVMGSDVPGLRDLVNPHETGWLVTPESPEAIASTLTDILSQPEIVRALGARAKGFAQDYSWQRIARRHIELYEELLQKQTLRLAR